MTTWSISKPSNPMLWKPWCGSGILNSRFPRSTSLKRRQQALGIWFVVGEVEIELGHPNHTALAIYELEWVMMPEKFTQDEWSIKAVCWKWNCSDSCGRQ